MQDIDAQHRGQGAVAAGITVPSPIGIMEIDALRGLQVGGVRTCAPGGNALEMGLVDIAGPPRDP